MPPEKNAITFTTDLKAIAAIVLASEKVILSTHRQCDGDGLGSELAVYWALKKIKKNVRVINFDRTPKKYKYLQPDDYIAYFNEQTLPLDLTCDLALIFDTNDYRLLDKLYPQLEANSKQIAFIDHHPVLTNGPAPTASSVIDVRAASTGEMAFRLIQEMNIPLDVNIAKCLYTSVVFDTQLFRYIRSSAVTHEIAAQLLKFDIQALDIHRALFGNQTVQKMAFLAKALSQIEYYEDGRVAILKITDQDLFHYNVDPEESRDVIDMLMNIETLEAAVIFREDSNMEYKVSMRSKGRFEVLSVAESLGGGGHVFSAGAYVKADYADMKKSVIEQISVLFNKK
ncbi:MAG: DHH family phosphoesterase [Pseudobdellovibrionaceae bacterium]